MTKNALSWLAALSLLAVLAAAPSAHSAVIVDVIGNGNDVGDFSQDNEADFDIFWNNLGPVWVTLELTSGDTEDLMAFSGFHFNGGIIPWTDFHIELEGNVTWAEVNDIDAGFGGVEDVIVNPQQVWIFFNPPVPPGDTLILGDPDTEIDPEDWFIDVSALNEGDRFSIHLHPTVPEPSSLVLVSLAGAAGLAGAALRRRRRQRLSA